MNQEVDAATQAEMAVKLSDNVKDLVRMHLKNALEDPAFTHNLNGYPLAQVVSNHLTGGDYNFQQAVKIAMIHQMNKY
jgi:hypothetical protein